MTKKEMFGTIVSEINAKIINLQARRKELDKQLQIAYGLPEYQLKVEIGCIDAQINYLESIFDNYVYALETS